MNFKLSFDYKFFESIFNNLDSKRAMILTKVPTNRKHCINIKWIYLYPWTLWILFSLIILIQFDTVNGRMELKFKRHLI